MCREPGNFSDLENRMGRIGDRAAHASRDWVAEATARHHVVVKERVRVAATDDADAHQVVPVVAGWHAIVKSQKGPDVLKRPLQPPSAKRGRG
jgi:hypothetical protein